MSVWQTGTKAISWQKKLSGQGCSRQLEERQALSRTMDCCGLHLLHQGKTFLSRGKTKNTDMYTGGALFMHMSSKQVENVFQQHLNTHETLKAKQDFKLKCKDAGVIPLEYILDNGTAFTSKSYTSHLSNFSPISLKFNLSGVGEHNQNEVAEKAIQTIMSIARMTEFRQPLQVQSHLEMPGILVQLGHTQRT